MIDLLWKIVIRQPALTLLLLGLALAGCGRDESPATPPTPTAAPTSADTPQFTNAPLPAMQRPHDKPRRLEQDDWFEDVTEKSGVSFAYHDGADAGYYTLLETVGGGVALFDYDRDGDLDLYFTGGGGFQAEPASVVGRSGALYRNDGAFKFVDVTQPAGLHETDLYSHGVDAADYDRDGDTDLVLTGYRGLKLYQNTGNGTFREVAAAAGLDGAETWNVGPAWGDFDGDGLLDLYVATYADWNFEPDRTCFQQHPELGTIRDTCPPLEYPGQRDRLFRNLGDGSFREISQIADLSAAYRGMGAISADLDGDGFADFLAANDVHPNELRYGAPERPTADVGALAGVAYSPSGKPEGSMGVDAGDFDGDGLLDLVITNYAGQDNQLLRAVAGRGFLDVSDVTGISRASRQWVGFGVALADFDGDGWPDLVVSNGHVLYGGRVSPYYQPAQLFRNIQGQRYEEVSARGGPYFSVPHAGRGLATGDLNNDGGLDLVVVHQTDPIAILKGRQVPDRWLRVELRGTRANSDAIGAVVSTRMDERTLVRPVVGGGSYLSRSDRRIIFPLDHDGPAEVSVKWPNGKVEVFSDLDQRKTHVLAEGSGN